MRLFTTILGRAELVGLGWLVGVAGGAGFLAAFQLNDLLVPLLVGGLVGAVAAAGGRERFAVAVALLAGLLAAGTLPALGAGPWVLAAVGTTDGLATIRDAVSVPATPQTLAVPYLATASAAFAATRVGRTGWQWTALPPSFAVLVLGLVLGDPAGPVAWPVPAAWAAAGLLVVSWRRGLGTAERALSTGFKLVVLGLVVVVGAVPLAERTPLRAERWVVPHTVGAYQVPPGDQPLARVINLRSGPDEVLFTAETSAPVFRWRLTALDRYDGVSWSRQDADYRPTAAHLPRSPEPEQPTGQAVDQVVQVHLEEGHDRPVWGPWLPAAEGVVETSRDDLLYDRGTASLAIFEDAAVPRRYDVVSRPRLWDDVQLREGSAADDVEARANLSLGPGADRPGVDADELRTVMDDLDVVAETITAGATTDHDRAVELSRYLVGEGELLVEEDAPSGHTLRHVHTMLLNQEGMQGTAEQYVSAYAVLARRLGLPTRIVVGFQGSGATGVSEVRTTDATAWVEVRFDGIGWVPFDAVPTETGDVLPPGGAAPEENEPEELPEEDEGADDRAEEDAGGDPDRDDGSDGDRSSPGSSGPRDHLGVLILLLVAVILAMQIPALRRARRRHRRRQGTHPAERVAGAWATVVDDLVLAGVPRLTDRTAGTVVVRASRQVPTVAEELLELSVLANRSAFSGHGPHDGDGDRAWTLARSIVDARRRGRSRAQQFREYFHW